MGPTTTPTPFPGWTSMAVYVVGVLLVIEAAAWGARRLHRKAKAREVRFVWWRYVVVMVVCGVFFQAVDLGRLVVFPAGAWHWTTFRCWRARRRNPAQPEALTASSLRPIPVQVLPSVEVLPPGCGTVVTPDGQEWIHITYDDVVCWEPARTHPVEDRPLAARLVAAVRGGR